MGTKYIEGDLHIKGRLWQNEKEINVLLADYTKVVVDSVIVTSIADRKIDIIHVLRDITGWGLKDSKDFVESLSVGIDLKTHSYDDLYLTDTQITEFVTQTTEQNLMTFAIDGADIRPLKTITIPEDKKSIIFNDTVEVDLSNYATINYVDSKLGIWVPTASPVSTTITSAKGKSWECQYQVLKNTLTNKSKVEYTLYSLTEETATAELISFSLITTVTIGASYVTDTIGYANLPKPISGNTYWTFDSFTFDEASDVGNQCTPLPFRGSGEFETRILVIDDNPPASITFKKVIAKVSLYEK